ncbi:FAD-dependent oxidoreductase [Xanthobacter dioxanivorans]|uniref:Tryptophan 2-monooxygenase n=1 Tax=Xanthobacter dioxanivorans TaxID=2528964 RepID=A0A974PRC3_9HYPH|nr:NAD(P)/FAD-dependent oxidoreductase [Xanthobacter dioxanivorans]QRG07938.1 FAD-dependent oxidoreductase [Xanthobacter dioxanivorans]
MTDRDRSSLTRRTLLARGAALATLPLAATRALGQQNEPDVVIIGAGAAGISAARRIAEAGRSYVLLEASNRVGGRALTDTAAFGVPLDLGAARLNMPAARPMAAFGRAEGLDIHRAPDGGRLYLKGREANDSEYEDFVGTVRRAQRAIVAAGDAGRDLPAARVLADLGPWSDSARFVVGPLACAKELDQVSTVDASRAEEPDSVEVCAQGIGTLVSQLARPLTVRLETPVRSVELGGRQAVVQTGRGTLLARAVIVAVPPSVIAAGKLRILPALPPRYRTAIEKITLGAFDHIAFRLPRNPLGLNMDELLYFRAEGPRAYALRARIAGSDLYTLEVAGDVANGLADGPPEAATTFLKEALTREFGADLAKKVGKVHATRWTKEPWALGAFSCALPGFGNMRRAFTEVALGRLIFAGEHAHETLWGTMGGAWLSGERAAKQALALLGVRSG